MGSITKQIFFNAPLDKVWGIWTDVSKTPEWVDGVLESRITSSAREGKGLAWDEKCLMAGKKEIQMSHKFTEWEDKKHTKTETGLPMGASMETLANFKPSQTGTEVNMTVEWDLGIVGAMMGDDKVNHIMEKAFNLTTEKWKAKAEKS